MEKKKILIVDDEKDLVDSVKIALEVNHYAVFAAYDGEQAFQMVEEVNPDLIVLDIMLPKKDGFQVCEQLKKDPKYANIPVIMLTAKEQEEDIKLAKKVGANAYISKPFEIGLLFYNITNLLK
ncbi:MAG: response regulator [Candidatus Omnitrophica bacterium]|nr:response regulator [Candidatus Omnitrophota bacterium]